MTNIQAFYLNHGYVVVRGLFEAERLDQVFADIYKIFRQQAERYHIITRRRSDRDSFSDMVNALFKVNQPAYLAAAKLAQYTISLHRLSLSDEILSVLGKLGLKLPTVSTRQVLHFIADTLRIEQGYHKTPPHQDWRSVQGSLDSLGVWVPFQDVNGGNYPLEVIPGSHRLGLLPSTEDPFGHRLAEGIIDETKFVPVEMSRGDAVFFSNFLVHRTGEKGGTSIRVAASFRFNNAAEPTFIARNYPNPYIYRPDKHLLFEGFPKQPDVAATFQ
jgi:phytanoyl-CoA hydroxylase